MKSQMVWHRAGARLCVTAAAFAALTSFSAFADVSRYTATIQGSGYPERYTQLEVVDYDTNPPAIRRAVLETQIPAHSEGDIFLVEGALQVTNDLNYAVELACRLLYSPSSGSVDPAGSGNFAITPEHGYNVTPQDTKLKIGSSYYNPVWQLDGGSTQTTSTMFAGEHHGIFPFSATFVGPGATAPRYIAFVCYAGGSSLTQTNDVLNVDYLGHMSVLRFH
jgi:hypothetical protein